MNTSSKFQRTCLIGVAAITLTGSGLVASSASAKTETPGGGHALTHRGAPAAPGFSAAPLRIFDEGDYVAARKVAMAQYRIDHALLYL